MAKTQKTVSTSQIVTTVCDMVNNSLKEKKLSLPKRIVKDIIAEFLGTIVSEVAAGGKVRIDHIGVLQVKARPARKGRNPRTGEELKIPAGKKISFRFSKSLKEKASGGKKVTKPKKRK